MKCPKCSYISFDYNQICPKCNKDIADEQRKLNLPGYRPEPPSLLEALAGAAGESQIGLEVGSFKDTSELEKEIATGMDDTGVMEKEAVFGSGAEEFKMEESLPEETEGLEEIELEPAGTFQDEEILDLASVDLQAEGALEGDTDLSHSQSEMLTVELEAGEKKKPDDMENLRMDASGEDSEKSAQ